MKHTNLTLSLTVPLACCAFSLFFPKLIAQEKETACEKLQNLGKFYDNPESKSLQNIKLFLSYMHQYGYVDGKDGNGKSFDDSMEETRRFWMGLQGKFATYWKFKAVSQLSNDRHNYPGDYRLSLIHI